MGKKKKRKKRYLYKRLKTTEQGGNNTTKRSSRVRKRKWKKKKKRYILFWPSKKRQRIWGRCGDWCGILVTNVSLIPLKYRASIERKNNFHPFGAHFIIKHRRQRLKAAPHHWLCTRTRSCAFKNHLNEILTDDGKLFVPPFNCGPSRSFAPLEGWHPLTHLGWASKVQFPT